MVHPGRGGLGCGEGAVEGGEVAFVVGDFEVVGAGGACGGPSEDEAGGGAVEDGEGDGGAACGGDELGGGPWGVGAAVAEVVAVDFGAAAGADSVFVEEVAGAGADAVDLGAAFAGFADFFDGAGGAHFVDLVGVNDDGVVEGGADFAAVRVWAGVASAAGGEDAEEAEDEIDGGALADEFDVEAGLFGEEFFDLGAGELAAGGECVEVFAFGHGVAECGLGGEDGVDEVDDVAERVHVLW